jgi:hypothetical protein
MSAVTSPETGHPTPPRATDQWTSARPLVGGAPVVIGAVIVGLAVVALLTSIGQAPGLAAQLSQD